MHQIRVVMVEVGVGVHSSSSGGTVTVRVDIMHDLFNIGHRVVEGRSNSVFVTVAVKQSEERFASMPCTGVVGTGNAALAVVNGGEESIIAALAGIPAAIARERKNKVIEESILPEIYCNLVSLGSLSVWQMRRCIECYVLAFEIGTD